MEIRPVSSREYLVQTKYLFWLKIFLVGFLVLFIGLFSMGIFEFLNFILRIHLPFPDWMLRLGWFGLLLFALPRVFDYFFINYLNNTTYKIYKDRINYLSLFPVYVETDISLKNVVEISCWQTEIDKNSDIGSITLGLKNSRAFPLLFVPDFERARSLIKELINK